MVDPVAAQTPRPLRATRLIACWAWRIFAWASLICGLYFLACLIGSFIPANNAWQEPSEGIEIFVETNGVHTALVLRRISQSADGKVHDWAEFLPPENMADPQRLGEFLSFSWGERDFFLQTENWSDVRPSVLAKAVIGSSRTLMHVYHYNRPRENAYFRSLVLTPQQHEQLIAIIKAKFQTVDGKPSETLNGYGTIDMFYAAHGFYSPFNTCNAWTGETLRAIGVRTGIWTPMAGGVMHWFPQEKP